MNDEEKKAIERAEFLIKIDTYLEKEMLTNLLNLIEKQSKEIEELKSRNQGKKEALEEWINGERVSIYCVHKNKIKAKIEELDDLNSPFAQRVIKGKEVYLTEMVQNILRELLEKE